MPKTIEVEGFLIAFKFLRRREKDRDLRKILGNIISFVKRLDLKQQIAVLKSAAADDEGQCPRWPLVCGMECPSGLPGRSEAAGTLKTRKTRRKE